MEIWEFIPNYYGYYKVSNFGRIKRINHSIKINNHPMQKIKNLKEKILKTHIGGKGYPMASICKNGKHEKRPIHIFVCRTFIGPPPEGKEVNHIDGNKLNNNINNLEYVTYKENLLHAVRMGLRKVAKGENFSSSKLSNKDIVNIRNEFINKKTKQSELAKKYNVHPAHISRIVNRKNWKHI